MTTLLDLVTSDTALISAWEDVRARVDTQFGTPREILRFARRAESGLDEIRRELIDGVYVPQPLREFTIEKDDGGRRTIRVPPVRDRIVERAILTVVTPHADPQLRCAAHGYRPGLGVATAVEAVAALRDEGLGWVLRADVDECFPSIDEELAVGMLTSCLPDRSLEVLLAQLVTRPVRVGRRTRMVRGLAQGASLSPLLANLVLSHLDDALLDAGFPVVRFADDFTVACASEAEGRVALEVARAALSEVGLRMGEEATEIMQFSDGFCFLGEEFGPEHPAAAGVRIDDPIQRVLYVARQGSRVRVQAGQVVVESRDEEELIRVPTSHLRRIVCFGSVGVTAGARAWAMGNDVEVVFLSRTGRYQGMLLGGGAGRRVARLRRQLAAADTPSVATLFARAVVGRKIRNQLVLLQKLNRRDVATHTHDAMATLRDLSARTVDAPTIEGLLGIEGAAARRYFQCLTTMVPAEVGFIGRGERPAQDIVNAALNFGYALLVGECTSALVAAGLDPAIGLIHSDDDGRPSLALDLMEEFRPLIVDQVVFTLVRRRTLGPESGALETGAEGRGFRLDTDGRGALLDAYERRMLQVTAGALPNFAGSMRRHLYRQAQRLAVYCDNPDVGWSGLTWR